MAEVISAVSRVDDLVIAKTPVISSDFNVAKIFAHSALSSDPILTDVALISGGIELAATVIVIDSETLGVTASASIATPLAYSRLYLTNSQNTILYVMDIVPEQQSEINIAVMLRYNTTVSLVGF